MLVGQYRLTGKLLGRRLEAGLPLNLYQISLPYIKSIITSHRVQVQQLNIIYYNIPGNTLGFIDRSSSLNTLNHSSLYIKLSLSYRKDIFYTHTNREARIHLVAIHFSPSNTGHPLCSASETGSAVGSAVKLPYEPTPGPPAGL